jgi:beta-carotene 15,15'-dioxygenase
MIRILLLLIGLGIMGLQHYVQPLPNNLQFIIFLIGIILLGIPHGAADLLVANQNADSHKKPFSRSTFFITYLGRLVFFAAILWILPTFGFFLFIILAAYHFGETDLHQFKTDNIAGKLFIISYGLVILGVILLKHFEEVKPILSLFLVEDKYNGLINWIDIHRFFILSIIGIFFFISTFFYFLTHNKHNTAEDYFLLQFAIILIVLYNMPMVLGFTFYFVVWHSLLSLRNIVSYLRENNLVTNKTIFKQIGFYSTIAIVGVILFGLMGYMFSNDTALTGYIFLGLAVLTAPHMQVMHDMYGTINKK